MNLNTWQRHLTLLLAVLALLFALSAVPVLSGFTDFGWPTTGEVQANDGVDDDDDDGDEDDEGEDDGDDDEGDDDDGDGGGFCGSILIC